MATDTEMRQAALERDRATIERVKENYAHYDLPLLRVMHRQTQAKESALRQDLQSGAAAKKFRHSGDLIESLQQVQWAADQAALVAEGLEALIKEKEAAA